MGVDQSPENRRGPTEGQVCTQGRDEDRTDSTEIVRVLHAEATSVVGQEGDDRMLGGRGLRHAKVGGKLMMFVLE